MCRQELRLTGCSKLVEEDQNGARAASVETECRLVEKEHRRRPQRESGEAESPLLALAEPERVLGGQISEAESGEDRIRAGRRRTRDAAPPRPTPRGSVACQHLAADGPGDEAELGILEDHPNLAGNLAGR